MASGDFFTLTELKDGLTTTKRVEELLATMHKDKHCVVKNVCEATRQWCTVARTIAATENKECLDLFIELDGLWFFNRWLEDAQKLDSATCDNFVEETIVPLLGALERLNLDKGKLFSYGIWLHVKNLRSHSSTKVQDSARALFDTWKLVDDDCVEARKVDGSALLDSKESASDGNFVKSAKDVKLPVKSIDGVQVKQVRDVVTNEHVDVKVAAGTPSTQNPVQEAVPVDVERPERCTSLDIKPGSNEKNSDAQVLNVGGISDKPINSVASSPNGPVACKEDSSVEMSPRRSVRQKLNLDLNLNDDGQLSDDPSGHKNRTSSSLSSPMQHFIRNIDLNGGPSIHYDSTDGYSNLRPSSLHESANGGVEVKPFEPVISIMGTKVEVNRNRKDILPKFMLFQDGKSPEAAIDVDLPKIERLQMMNPRFHSMPLWAAPGGPRDISRSYHQQHFMNILTGAPPSQTNFINMNSNFMNQRGSKDEDGLMQLFPPGPTPVISIDDRSSSQADSQRPSSSSGILGKRNESEYNGWETYPFNIKHHQPHWRGVTCLETIWNTRTRHGNLLSQLHC